MPIVSRTKCSRKPVHSPKGPDLSTISLTACSVLGGTKGGGFFAAVAGAARADSAAAAAAREVSAAEVAAGCGAAEAPAGAACARTLGVEEAEPSAGPYSSGWLSR